jgi:hypothetical protein
VPKREDAYDVVQVTVQLSSPWTSFTLTRQLVRTLLTSFQNSLHVRCAEANGIGQADWLVVDVTVKVSSSLKTNRVL